MNPENCLLVTAANWVFA